MANRTCNSLMIRTNQITQTTRPTKKHPRVKPASDRYLPDPVLGFSGSHTRDHLTHADPDIVWRLWRTAFVFYNDHLPSHREFENALIALRSRVSQRDDANRLFNTHVFEHRELIRDCDYCMLPNLEKTLQELRDR